MARSISLPAGRPARLGLLLIAVMAAVTIGVRPGAARDAFVAGSPSTTVLPLDDTAREAALRRASLVARALGLPEGARRVVARIEDRFAGTVLDEVTTYDAAGRPIAILRSGRDGSLQTAVSLGWSSATGQLTVSRAIERASGLLDAAGIAPTGRPTAAADRSGHGWNVAWPRHVDGVPVRGDGTWVRLWPDGSVHSVAIAYSTLAPAPRSALSSDEARRLAEAQVATWSAGGTPVAAIAGLEFAWVAPNDLFDPSRPDAPDPVRRLAWVAHVTPLGALASRLTTIDLYIDAGDGRLLGGDLLE